MKKETALRLLERARELCQKYSSGTVIIFKDRTVSYVSGSWEAQKPVLLEIGVCKNAIPESEIDYLAYHLISSDAF